MGGRWNQTALRLVKDLARIKARSSPESVRKAVQHAYSHRWWNILSVAAQTALATSYLHHPQVEGAGESFDLPTLTEVLQEAAYTIGPVFSRLA